MRLWADHQTSEHIAEVHEERYCITGVVFSVLVYTQAVHPRRNTQGGNVRYPVGMVTSCPVISLCVRLEHTHIMPVDDRRIVLKGETDAD